jgi:3-keto-5-aminohexanoate cleavage enzyme
MASKKVIITVAPTSNFHGKEANPALPEQPDEIAAATYDCYNAGAALVHIHARDKNGVQTNSTEVFREINAKVRAKCPIIIQNSIAPALKPGGSTAEEGLQAIDAGPEMCSLDLAISVPVFRGQSIIIEWTREFHRKAARMMLDRGIKAEMEIFNDSSLDDANELIAAGLLTKPYSFSFVMNMHKVNQGGVRWTPRTLQHFVDLLPPDSIFSALGVGNAQVPATTMSMILGGGARVGFEDNIYYRRGELAKSNAQLVERAVNTARDLGLEIATPAEAREILGIPQLKAAGTAAG